MTATAQRIIGWLSGRHRREGGNEDGWAVAGRPRGRGKVSKMCMHLAAGPVAVNFSFGHAEGDGKMAH